MRLAIPPLNAAKDRHFSQVEYETQRNYRQVKLCPLPGHAILARENHPIELNVEHYYSSRAPD
jgi:hypothetical protein